MTQNQIAIFTNKDGSISVDVKLENNMIWLTQNQIAQLFEKERSVITKHIGNILKENELDKSVCANFAHTGSDGKSYQTNYYNLDMIISVGYRVNSKRGIEFLRWANEILKDYLINGYSLNSQKINSKRIDELKQTIELLSNTLVNQQLIDSEGKEILSIIKNYTRTWDILIKYDENRLKTPNNKQLDIVELTYDSSILAIKSIKKELHFKGESVELFGNESNCENQRLIL